MPFLITKASNMHRLLILLVISLAYSVPVEEDTHPDGNFLDSAAHETFVYEENTEALVGESTDGPVLAAIDEIIQQLNETKRTESPQKPKMTSHKTLVLPKEVTISSGSIQSVANETGRRQSKRVRFFDDDGIQIIEGVYKPDDPNDKKTYRNARVINNQLIENSTVNWAEVSGRNGRFFGDDTPKQISESFSEDSPQSAGNAKDRYPEFYYRSFYGDEDQPEKEAVQTSTTTKNPFGYSPSLHDSSDFHYVPFKDSDNSRHGALHQPQHFKQGRELAVTNDNQQYVVRQQLYRNGDGSAFMVPIPYPTNNDFQYDQSNVQYQPYAFYKEKSKAEMMKDKVGEIVSKVHDFARPIVDPLKEAGDKISYNLGLPEKVSHFQSRLSKASHDPKTMVAAGGAAAALGAIGVSLFLGSAAVSRSAKKLKQSRNTATAHNITRRDVAEEFQIEPEQIELDQILKKLDSSQNQLLEEMHKTGFLKSIEGPCGKAVMCQTLASDTSDYQLSLIRRRASLFAELLDGSEAQHLRKSIDGIVDAAKQGDCSVFDCEGEKLSEFLREQSEVPR